MPAITVSTGLRKADDVTKRSRPKGGVIMPMQMFRQTTSPKWMGSMPSAVATGKMAGSRMTMMELGSMNIPAINSTTLMISRKTIQFTCQSLSSMRS